MLAYKHTIIIVVQTFFYSHRHWVLSSLSNKDTLSLCEILELEIFNIYNVFFSYRIASVWVEGTS